MLRNSIHKVNGGSWVVHGCGGCWCLLCLVESWFCLGFVDVLCNTISTLSTDRLHVEPPVICNKITDPGYDATRCGCLSVSGRGNWEGRNKRTRESLFWEG